MNRRISDEAFSFYVGLGSARSYAAVAKRFGVSRRTVASAARRDDWQPRLASAADEARKKTDEKIVETLEDLNERHLKVGKFVMSKGLEALRAMAITRPADALRAIAQGIEHERAVFAQSDDRVETSKRLAAENDARRQAEMIRQFLSEAEKTVPGPPGPASAA